MSLERNLGETSDIARIDFQTAETMIATSLIQGRPNLLVVGANGIGKSHLLEQYAQVGYEADKSEPNFLTDFIDMGGASSKQFYVLAKKLRIRNILIDDLDSILSRKYEVVEATLSKIRSMSDGKRKNNITFQNRNEITMQLPRFNFVIACTPMQLRKLEKMKSGDFLSRFIAIFLKNPDGYYDTQLLETENGTVDYLHTLPRKIKLREHDTSLTNPRHLRMYDELLSGLDAFGIKQVPPLHFWQIDENGVGDWSSPWHFSDKLARLSTS